MYTTRDFKTKKALKEAVANGETLTVFQPGPCQGNETRNGLVSLEGPHYPKPHTWYARVLVEDGVIVEVE